MENRAARVPFYRSQTARYIDISVAVNGAFTTVFALLSYLFGNGSGYFATIDLTELILFLIVGLTLIVVGVSAARRIPSGR
jgi:hypothetical protein